MDIVDHFRLPPTSTAVVLTFVVKDFPFSRIQTLCHYFFIISLAWNEYNTPHGLVVMYEGLRVLRLLCCGMYRLLIYYDFVVTVHTFVFIIIQNKENFHHGDLLITKTRPPTLLCD